MPTGARRTGSILQGGEQAAEERSGVEAPAVFSQTTEYALRAAAQLALTPESLVPTGDLAKATRVPAHYLAKVLQQLSAAKVITGRRGVGGGYRLARAAQEITLRDVVTAVSPIQRITACPLGMPCERGLCPLHRMMDSVAADVLKALDGKTLADLAEGHPGWDGPLCVRADGQGGTVQLTTSRTVRT